MRDTYKMNEGVGATMGRKCSVGGCKTGYDSQKGAEKVTLYGFPSDETECRAWIASLPNILSYEKVSKSKNISVCALHFPQNVPLVRRGSKLVPTVPPSIFPNVPSSSIPTPQSTPRPTSKSRSDCRAVDIDEMPEFLAKDKFKNAENFRVKFQDILSEHGLFAWERTNNKCVLLSHQREGPIHTFAAYFDFKNGKEEGRINSVAFKVYKSLKSITIPLFPKETMSKRTQLEELQKIIKTDGEKDRKQDFLCRQVELMNVAKNTRVYDSADLCQALSWCARSRALYSEIRECLQLPSVSTIKKMTRIVKNTEDNTFFKTPFDGKPECERGCVLIVDEIYVKASISFRGGVIFGYAADDKSKKATTLLCIMVKCFFGGKKFVAKVIPCHALKAVFQFECVKDVILSLENCGAKVVGIINDNNRKNQSFFKMFTPIDIAEPWIVQSLTDATRKMFLVFDPVHITKNIRNNWITEKTKTLRYPLPDSPDSIMAKWSDLQELYQAEEKAMVKLSKLTKPAIAPTSTEKQKVSLALNVFCDQTSCALKT